MDWDIVLPRSADHLDDEHCLGIVEEVHEPKPRDDTTGKTIGRYSLNRDFQPYTMLTIAEQLERRSLFQQQGI